MRVNGEVLPCTEVSRDTQIDLFILGACLELDHF